MIKFRFNPLICCLGDGAGDYGGGASGRPTTGNSSIGGGGWGGMYGNYDYGEYYTAEDGYTNSDYAGDYANPLQDKDWVNTVMANTDSFWDRLVLSWDYINSNMGNMGIGSFGLSFGLPTGAMTVAQALGALAMATTGSVSATMPDTNALGDTTDEKTIWEWISDPNFKDTFSEQYPELDYNNLQDTVKYETDKLMMSILLGEAPASGMDAAEWEQGLNYQTDLIQSGQGRYDVASSGDTPDWFKAYLTNGTIPEFLTDVTEEDTIDIGGRNVTHEDFRNYFDTATPDTVMSDMTKYGMGESDVLSAVNTAYGTDYTEENSGNYFKGGKTYQEWINPTTPETETTSYASPILTDTKEPLDFSNGIMSNYRTSGLPKKEERKGILQNGRR